MIALPESGHMGLGYRGNDTWRDMSEYVVHFTSGADGSDGYDAVMGILGCGLMGCVGN